MSIQFIESFSGYGPEGTLLYRRGEPFAQRWRIQDTNLAYLQVGDGYNGGLALRADHIASGFRIQTPTFANSGTVIVGTWFKYTGSFVSGVSLRVMEFTDVAVTSSSIRPRLLLTSDGNLVFNNGSVTLDGTGLATLEEDTWYFIEAKVTIHNTTGAVEIRVNGVTDLILTNVNTRPSGTNNYCNAIRLWAYIHGTANVSVFWDDFYVANVDGNGVQDFLGPALVSYHIPESDSTVAWTPNSGSTNYSRVNEAPPDGDTSYVETSTSNAEDLYGISDLDDNYEVYAVQANYHAVGSSSSFDPIVRHGSTTDAGSTVETGSDYSCGIQVWEKNPVTNNPWTANQFNSATFGVRQVSGTPRLSRLSVDVLRTVDPIPDPLKPTATSTLVLDQIASFEQGTQHVESSIPIAQDVTVSGIYNKAVESVLTLSQRSLPDRDVDNVLTLTQLATGLAVKELDSFLMLSQEAHRSRDAVSAIVLTQSATVPWGLQSILELDQIAEAILPGPTNLVRSTLSLNHEATVGKTLGLSVTSNILLQQAISSIPLELGCTWDGIDTPTQSRTKGLLLAGDTVVDISRSMNYGDIDRLAFDRIVRETRGGTLHVYADPIWPKTESLLFSISSIRRAKAYEVLDFLVAHLGREITLTTHEGRQWVGFVTNPNEAVTEDRPNSYTITIEFEGQVVQSSLRELLRRHGLYLGVEVDS